MKNIIHLFAFVFVLRPSLFALSISSDKIDTFMNIPEWMPTSVDAESTFGSSDHTNGTRRVTVDTLAAVESIFDAYYERAFFTSEGRNNNWNVSICGPRAVDEESLKTITFGGNISGELWAYRSQYQSESIPRAVYDSRRMFEFQNIFDCCRFVAEFMFDDDLIYETTYHQLYIPRGHEPWGHLNSGGLRRVFLGSSLMPCNAHVSGFGWRSGFPSLNEWPVTNSCLPLIECRPGDFWRSSDEYRSGRSEYSLHENFIGGVNFLNLESYLRTMRGSRPWVGDQFSELMAEKFPGCGLGDPVFTYRLIPDDGVTYDITTSLELVHSDRISIDLSEDLTDGTPGPSGVTYRFKELESYDIDEDSGAISNITVFSAKEGDAEECRLAHAASVEIASKSDVGADFIVVNAEDAGEANGWFSPYWGDKWLWGNPYFEFDVEYWKNVVTTNSVTTNLSVTAAASRALASIDRSYELPPRQTKVANVISSNLVQKAESSAYYRVDGTYVIGNQSGWTGFGTHWENTIEPGGPLNRITPRRDSYENSMTSSYTGGNLDTRAKVRFSGVQSDISVGLIINESFYATMDQIPGQTYPERGDGTYVFEIFFDGQIFISSTRLEDGSTYWKLIHLHGPDNNFNVTATATMIQNATFARTTMPGESKIDGLYPAYGPGTLSFSTHRVSSCSAAVLMSMISYDMALDISQDMWYSVYENIESCCMTYTIPNNYAVISYIRQSLLNGWNRMNSKVNSYMGGSFSKDITSGRIEDVVVNMDNMFMWRGGRFILECGQYGYNEEWPSDLSYAFTPEFVGEDPIHDSERAHEIPFSADLLISDPLISTEWNWKALKIDN